MGTAVAAAAAAANDPTYFVVGSWNDWDFEEMTLVDSLPGVFRLEVNARDESAEVHGGSSIDDLMYGWEFQIVWERFQDRDASAVTRFVCFMETSGLQRAG